MPSYNKVILIGNLTRDPELRYLPNQTAVASFGMAINRRFKGSDGADREEVCFVDITAFGRQAEVVQQYVHKGDPLMVEGRLKYETWDDKQGGGKRSKLSVVLDGFQFLKAGGNGSSEQGHAGYGESQAPPARRSPAPPPYPKSRQSFGSKAQQSASTEGPFTDGEQVFKDDDIPF